MIITQTPLRLSLLGGNTDFRQYYLNYGGAVLSTTIDKYIYCIVKKRFDDRIYINYSQKEIVDDVEDIQHDLVRECMKLTGVLKGIEITFLSDVPSEGSGLGSSSAVTVGLLNALYCYTNNPVSPDVLAEEAIKIEIDILGSPIGVQDQYAVAIGGLKLYELKQSGKIVGNNLTMPESIKEDFNNSLMLLYTGITRKADGILSSFDFRSNKPLLDQNKQFAIDGVSALLKGDLNEFGKILNTYWEVKQQLSNKISNPKIQDMYLKALDAGAIGGKVIGAGGGGFLLVMFPANKRARVREALKDYEELPFRFSNFGSRVIFNI